MKALELLTAVVLSFLGRTMAEAVGRVPDGPHTSEEMGMISEQAGIDACNGDFFCAGVTTRPPKREGEEATMHFHAIVPKLLDEPSGEWTTHRSNKTFVFQPGKIESKNVLSVLTENVDPSNLSLPKAQELCEKHPKCVGFSFPTKSAKLFGFDEIIFFASIDSFSHAFARAELGDRWRSWVKTDERVLDKINVHAFFYDDDLEYGSCCNRAEVNKTTGEVVLPTIQEVEAMDTLPRIPCTISKEEFQVKYEMTRTPVMLVDCDKDWPAKQLWKFPNLIHRFDNDTLWRTKREFTQGDFLDNEKWKEISEDMASGKLFMVFDTLDRPGRESILEEYSVPHPFQGTDLYDLESDMDIDWTTLRWFCLGSYRTGTMPHKDPYGTDAWNSVLVGHKWWTLYPPGVTSNSVECNDRCSPKFPTLPDWYGSVAINLARTQYSYGKMPMHVLQKPGETIYVPYEMVHSVINMAPSVAITANYGSPGNLQKVWETVLREGSEEQWKKMYYETFTDEQRKAVREGDIWPPEDFAGYSIGSSDDYSEDDSGDDDDYEEEEEDYDDGGEL